VNSVFATAARELQSIVIAHRLMRPAQLARHQALIDALR
jgi:hypothetical protein